MKQLNILSLIKLNQHGQLHSMSVILHHYGKQLMKQVDDYYIKSNLIETELYSYATTILHQLLDNYEKYHKIENGTKYAFVASTIWFTNLDYKKRHDDLTLYKTYVNNKSDYPKYDHYDAINVNKTKDIPMDYKGRIGVPITFLTKYNPKQFEIIEGLNRYSILEGPTAKTRGKYLAQVNGKPIYVRIVIRNKKI